MWTESAPRVDQWYLRHDTGEMFRVVAMDSSMGTVEIQTFDGDVEELDTDVWREVGIEAAGAPEDFTGPFDDLEPGDLGYTETAVIPRDWRHSLDVLAAAGGS